MNIDGAAGGSSPTTVLEPHLAQLRDAAIRWRVTPLDERLDLLRRARRTTAAVAQEWVRLACAGKGIRLDAPAAGEEWMSGPYALLTGLAALADTVGTLCAGAHPLDGVRSRSLPNGQVALCVFPIKADDRMLMGHSGEVWLRPGVSLQQARAGVARELLDPTGPARITLVLGAGNISSIAALDALGELYGHGAAVLVKLNPVNDYLEPVLNAALSPYVESGLIRITTGDAGVGSALINHPEVDRVHITGSAASHDAIVFGAGPDGAARKAGGEPLLAKPITSELGGVGPAVVLPGQWSERALRAQARHIATQRLHNSGFNCVATQIVVVAEDWPQRRRFLDHLRDAIRLAPARPAYYPGAQDRQANAVREHADAELLGGDTATPRTLLPDLDAADPIEPAFSEEYFGPVLGVVTLPGGSTEEFLDAAIEFCNSRLAGSLGVNLLGTPRTLRRLGGRLDAAVAALRYGTVAINTWVGPIFAMARATWGGFPGSTVRDPDSGIGVVHNALLIDPDHIERSVGRGPFRLWPKPLWFVDNRAAHRAAAHLTRFAGETSPAKAAMHVLRTFAAALRG